MAIFPADVAKLGGSTRLCNCLRNLDEKSMEEVIAKLEDPYTGGETYFLRQPNFGRRTLNELKELIPLWKSNNNRNVGATLLFTECLDRCLEAEREMYYHSGTDTPEYDKAKERRDRHRKVLIETFERML